MSRSADDARFYGAGRWAIVQFPSEPDRALVRHMEKLGWRKVGRLPRWYAAAEERAGPQAREFASMWEEGVR